MTDRPSHRPPSESCAPAGIGRGASRRRCAPTWWIGCAAGESLLPGIIGYDETVLPQVENAILAGQDIILLGERGQAKSRIARSLVGLLDEWMPVVAGAELHDDPLRPVSPFARSARRRAGRRDPDRLGARRRIATARSWPRRTSRSPTWSARWTRSRSPRGATSPTS